MDEKKPTRRRSSFQDLTGKVFNRLTVIGYDRTIGENNYWKCLCVCGVEKTVQGGSLKFGAVKSCGCLRDDKATKHGMYKRAEYEVWIHMIQRCNNPKASRFEDYGGRGITVCERWLNSVQDFISDMGPKPSGKHTIDRIDNNGNYEPSNCRWATDVEQRRNKRNNVFLSLSGRCQCVADWAAEVGIDRKTLYRRKKLGWSDERILKTPVTSP